uniref:Aquaporin n=1 Tax=Timema genevievae TaxID=629358 RepID=A0A7R9PM77_TIMGE|nr:unnamed protein product [Timema genevievae]
MEVLRVMGVGVKARIPAEGPRESLCDCSNGGLIVAGAHVNPAVTVAMAVTRNVSALRAFMFVTAQCGGGIAGAALLYGLAMPSIERHFKHGGPSTERSMNGWDFIGSVDDRSWD